MNYSKIYLDLCEICKETSPKERLISRNPSDFRINMNESEIYTEKHHIIPKHAGGLDEKSNLVVMLPEEHLLAHLLRYKAYNDRKDFISCRIIINGFKNKKDIYKKINNKSLLSLYALFRQNLYNFRKEHSWHTEDGVRRISESRKNKMLCVDSASGKKIGMVDTNHPNILNGTWISFYKNKVVVYLKENGDRKLIFKNEFDPNLHITSVKYTNSNLGNKNPNYKEMTLERRERVLSMVSESVEDGYLIKTVFEKNIKKEFKDDFKKISLVWVTNNFGTLANLVNEYNNIHNTDIQPPSRLFKTASCREKIRNANINKKRNKDDNN